MEKTPFDDYFSDNQTAVAMGMTLRSLRNKIHQQKTGELTKLPPYFQASARGRLWEKKSLEKFLFERFGDGDFVAKRMIFGHAAPPLGNLGASDESLKIIKGVKGALRAAPLPRKVGRPKKP